MLDLSTPCLPAAGYLFRGYAFVRQAGVRRRAHRVAWEAANGAKIPLGMVVDHACHNADTTCAGGDTCPHRSCVNPQHLELVTVAENNRRGRVNANKRACPQGHPYDAANTHVEQLSTGKSARRCLTCRRERDAARRAARKAA